MLAVAGSLGFAASKGAQVVANTLFLGLFACSTIYFNRAVLKNYE